jgi:hypothetical protein
MVPISKRFAVPCNCVGEGSLPAMSSVENRYAEARPNAAAMIAADWSGGAMQTSFR